MGILSNNSKIGDKGKDLILQTSGKVYVQVRDKFYPINFRETQKENTSDDEKTSDTKGVLIVEDINSYTGSYPGDNILIIDSVAGIFYRTTNGSYVQIPSIEAGFFTSPLSIQLNDISNPPIITNSSELVENLNAQYLSGHSSSEFAKKNSDESITGKWEFKDIVAKKVKSSSGTTILDLTKGELIIDSIITNSISNTAKEKPITIIKQDDGNIYIQLSNDENISNTILGLVKKIGEEENSITYTPWIEINATKCKINGITYMLNSDGTATFGPMSLNSDNTITIGNSVIDSEGNITLGGIKINSDGTATFGSGEYQATIDANGKFSIPEICILK